MSAEEAETKVPEKEEGAAGEEEEETVKEEESNAHFEPLVSCYSTCALVACGTSHCFAACTHTVVQRSGVS